MNHCAGINVSLEEGGVCVVDPRGQIVREAKMLSTPEALIGFFPGLALPLGHIGRQAGALSPSRGPDAGEP